METNDIIALRIKTLREENHYNQAEMGALLGVSASAIGFYENALRTPGADVIVRAAKAFGVTADYLIGLSNNRTVDTDKIGKGLGLSDKAIEILQEQLREFGAFTDFFNMSGLVSFLIEQEELKPDSAHYIEYDHESGKEIFAEDEYNAAVKKWEGKKLTPVLSPLLRYFWTIPIHEDAETIVTTKAGQQIVLTDALVEVALRQRCVDQIRKAREKFQAECV